ncbi:Phytosulfokine receptor 1 [Hibiscus syriacus]|uniref:non-specific serine/threonine protein kinase n=1 Tax=Hibiscus syriacus TaxID=106335 RepID=A0A6A3CS25_HIBSY|nr:phytosulfokine receptor 1-like [Hibiscus syriacus]KAE8730041.1 Phytosulfokine receptor 1 [Hibiscus syriacus]
MGAQDCWVLVAILGFLLQAQVLVSQNQTCNPEDLTALQYFMGNLTTKLEGWTMDSSTDCCGWEGITCEPLSAGRVIKLELQKKRLSGKLSDALAGLDQLKTLNLSRNFLKDSLPLSLFHMPNLEQLDLSSNDFSGPIPESINLPSIRSFEISWNYFNGSFPSHICVNSSRIRFLNLAVNYFSGDILSGLGQCSFLEELNLGTNVLTGGIAEDIFQLQNLKLLGLQYNNLGGKLSPGIANLYNLVRFDISSNNFSGEIPDVFGRLKSFQFLVAHSNKFSGRIPSSVSNSPTISLLNLRNNSLEGFIYLNCSAMVALNSLDLATNKFTGPVPDNLPLCRQLRNVNLARNNFSGQIPESFRGFHSLAYLSLSNSSLRNISSSLQTLQQCRNLTALVLTLNFPGETVPNDPNLRFEKLKVLVIASCKLKGSIPQWLRSITALQLLDLSWNHLDGTIPPWLGSYRDLFYLDLSNNSLTGEIPKSLTELPSLINGNISLEEPSPDFPFFMRRNESGRGLQYNQISSFPPTLEIGHNSLRGPIWPEFGNLIKLIVFDLKFNNFSGSIPGNLSEMISLEILDLSHNDLSETIPLSLERLSFLSVFNVAYNRLRGKIPSGGQFQTFPNSSFEGNNLCGGHRFNCQDNASEGRHESPKRSRSKNIIIGMVVGVILGTTFLIGLLYQLVLRTHKCNEVDPEKEEPGTNDKDLEELSSRLVMLFQNWEPYKELCIDDLLESANNFDQANIIGCGGFGLVYRGTLPDGRKVAIKRLSDDCGQMDREFHAEVEALSRAQHPNLVHLQGYCMHKNDRLLIYSYMENGSLDYWLHEKVDGPSMLDWETRLQIAQGAARGLAYLHQSCEPHILHRDIKSSNILLDGNFKAHLADFGLARLILPYDTHVTTDLVGTLGYIPPEYGQASVATYKGDVYSFGVVLLELLTGKRPMDMCKPKDTWDIISWVMRMNMENKESEVFDPLIYGKQHDKEMLRVLEIACLCLSESPKVRPTTRQLVSWLDKVTLISNV